MGSLLSFLGSKILGSRNQWLVKKLNKVVFQINQLDSEYAALSAAQLSEKTSEFKQRLEVGASLDSLLPEAFAVKTTESRLRLFTVRGCWFKSNKVLSFKQC